MKIPSPEDDHNCSSQLTLRQTSEGALTASREGHVIDARLVESLMLVSAFAL